MRYISWITLDQALFEDWYKPNLDNGFCMCGCGELAPVAKRTQTSKGWFKGESIRFIPGHHNRGIHNPMYGVPSPSTGRSLSVETKLKMSEDRKGSKNPAWKGGTTSINQIDRKIAEQKQWAIDVKNRDNYTCQCCGKRGGKLRSHHIRLYSLYPKLRIDLKNGITLCATCHKKVHDLLRGDGFTYA